MTEEVRLVKATLQIMERILEVDNLEDALVGSLETIIDTLHCEAGAIWFLDKKTDRLSPLYYIGSADISNISIENGSGIEGYVTETGESVMITDASSDSRFETTVFDDNGLITRSMICVPLNTLHEIIGCVQIINRKDGSPFTKTDQSLCERMAALAAITADEKGFLIDLGEKKNVLIRIRNLTKDFPSGDSVAHVLRGINLDIYEGEFLVILGESGCGKSTLVNIIAGMDSLTDGELMIEGKDFSHPSDDALTKFRRKYLGFVFQSYHLMPNLTALENVKFIAEIVDHPMSAEEAIALVGLTDRADNYPSMLSGGQQQRVSIARAIVKNPKIIFADEPTAALDYATSIEVLRVFEDIVEKQGTTVVMITHNPEIAKMADRVIKLRSGVVFSIRKNPHPAKAEELVW